MIDPWRLPGDATAAPAQRLDQHSRQAAAGFLLRLCGVSAIALWPYLAPCKDSHALLEQIAGRLGQAFCVKMLIRQRATAFRVPPWTRNAVAGLNGRIRGYNDIAAAQPWLGAML